MAGNHVVIASTYNRYLPNTILHLSVLFCSICIFSFPYTVILSLSTDHLSDRSGTTSYFLFSYSYFITFISFCEYGFLKFSKACDRYYVYSRETRWLDLSCVCLDLYIRKILGYSYGKKIDAELATNAVKNACLNIKILMA